MVQHLLHIVQRKAAEQGQATPQPHVLGEGQRAHGGGGEHEGREAGRHDDGGAGEEGPADVQVLLLLGGRADEGDGAHHGDGVETGAGDEGAGGEGEERGDEGGLGRVEGGPEGVLGKVAIIQGVWLA